MSDDLISRKAFMEYLGLKDTEENRKENVGEIVTLEDFDRQATAFDKEKVIEELKSAIGDIHYTEDGSFNGKCIEDFEFIQAKTALELVEKGGIE